MRQGNGYFIDLRVKSTFLIVSLYTVISGCKMGPDEAREKLARLNVEYTATAFVQSAEDGNIEIVKLFLVSGMSANTIDNAKGATALMMASSKGHIEIVKELITKGAKTDVIIYQGIGTALDCAIWGGGHLEIVKTLVENGADVTHDVVYLAIRDGHVPVLDFLISKMQVDQNLLNFLLITAIENDQFEAVRYLIQKGGNVNCLHPVTQMTALTLAYVRNNFDIIGLLEANGAKR